MSQDTTAEVAESDSSSVRSDKTAAKKVDKDTKEKLIDTAGKRTQTTTVQAYPVDSRDHLPVSAMEHSPEEAATVLPADSVNTQSDNTRQGNNPSFSKTEIVRTEDLTTLPIALWKYIRKSSEFTSSVLIALLSLSIGVLAWHLASTFNLNWYINFENVPTPGKVFVAFLGHLQTEVFYTHIGVSMRRIFISYSLAVVIGVLVGVLMGRSRVIRRFVMPYIEVVRPIPAVAWIPLAILMWPTEESSIIYITFLGALFPIVLNTLHGVEQTPDVLVRAAQSLGASRLGIFWHVVLPGALPSIAAGLAIGMGVSWFSLLAGEIISGQYGIGYFTWDAYSLINYQDIVVGMLVIGFLGTASTAAIKLLTKPMLHWQTKAR